MSGFLYPLEFYNSTPKFSSCYVVFNLHTWWAASESEEESSKGEENMARGEEVIELSGEVAIEAIEVAAPVAVGGS